MLKPVNFVKDPVRGEGNYLAVCEVFLPNGQPHPTNTRAKLRRVLEAGGSEHDPWIGFEQEYTMMDGLRPLGWPEEGYPGPQGPYYCSAGTGRVIGRELVERHAQACLRPSPPLAWSRGYIRKYGNTAISPSTFHSVLASQIPEDAPSKLFLFEISKENTCLIT